MAMGKRWGLAVASGAIAMVLVAILSRRWAGHAKTRGDAPPATAGASAWAAAAYLPPQTVACVRVAEAGRLLAALGQDELLTAVRMWADPEANESNVRAWAQTFRWCRSVYVSLHELHGRDPFDADLLICAEMGQTEPLPGWLPDSLSSRLEAVPTVAGPKTYRLRAAAGQKLPIPILLAEHAGWLLVATDEGLMESALARRAGAQAASLATVPAFADAVGARPPEEVELFASVPELLDLVRRNLTDRSAGMFAAYVCALGLGDLESARLSLSEQGTRAHLRVSTRKDSPVALLLASLTGAPCTATASPADAFLWLHAGVRQPGPAVEALRRFAAERLAENPALVSQVGIYAALAALQRDLGFDLRVLAEATAGPICGFARPPLAADTAGLVVELADTYTGQSLQERFARHAVTDPRGARETVGDLVVHTLCSPTTVPVVSTAKELAITGGSGRLPGVRVLNVLGCGRQRLCWTVVGPRLVAGTGVRGLAASLQPAVDRRPGLTTDRLFTEFAAMLPPQPCLAGFAKLAPILAAIQSTLPPGIAGNEALGRVALGVAVCPGAGGLDVTVAALGAEPQRIWRDATARQEMGVSAARLREFRSRDETNVKQLFLAILMSADDNGGTFPEHLAQAWPYIGKGDAFVCPGSSAQPPTNAGDIRAGQCDYVLLIAGRRQQAIAKPTQVPAIVTRPGLLGGEFVHVAYADGHVRSYEQVPPEVRQQLAALGVTRAPPAARGDREAVPAR